MSVKQQSLDDSREFPFTIRKEEEKETETENDQGVDYAAEYRKQTGRDLETGEYVTH